MNNLLLHQKTLLQLKNLASRPPHAILVTGQPGAGKLSLALELAGMLLGIESGKLVDYPYFSLIEKDVNGKEISIDAIRGLIKTLRLKTPGSADIRRIAIIDGAEAMSHAAQNSLLKLLEEPPADTVLVLTAPEVGSLLSTIVSRASTLEISPPTLKQALKFFAGSHSEAEIKSAWHMSQGASALLSALLSDAEHPLKNSVEQFKQFLGMKRYERLQLLEQISKNRTELSNFIDAGRRVLSALQVEAADKKMSSMSGRVIKSRKLLLESQQQLAASSSVRLIGLNIALNMAV